MHAGAMTVSEVLSLIAEVVSRVLHISAVVVSEELCISVVVACRLVQASAWTCQCRGSEQACIDQSSVSVWACAHRCSGGVHVLCEFILWHQAGPCISVQCQLLGSYMLL